MVDHVTKLTKKSKVTFTVLGAPNLLCGGFYDWFHTNMLYVLGCRTFISQVITGYLPSLILQLFLSLVPPIMIMLSSIQGYISLSQIEKSASNKVWWFTVWNAFFANVLSGTALYQVNVFLEPKNIPKVLAQAVPGQVKICLYVAAGSTFFIYGIFSNWFLKKAGMRCCWNLLLQTVSTFFIYSFIFFVKMQFK